MALHLENFVSIRKLYPRITERAGSTPRMAVADPASATERDYRDLLSEANLNFFHREYLIALQNYLALRHKILEQSHPEMPRVPGIGHLLDFDWNKVSSARITEMSRRMVAAKPLAGPAIHFALSDERLIKSGENRPDPVFARWSKVGVELRDGGLAAGLHSRDQARAAVKDQKFDAAAKQYALAGQQAEADGKLQLAAELANESAAMLTTFVSAQERPAALRSAQQSLERAEQLYARVGDNDAVKVVQRNRSLLQTGASPGGAPLVRNGSVWQQPNVVLDPAAVSTASMATRIGLFSPSGTKTLSLASSTFENELTESIYKPRVTATTLEELNFYEVVEVNFVAYFVHLYFFVLPVAIGDCYVAMGQYERGLAEYRAVLPYPFLNLGIEARYLWLKMAEAYLQWGNSLFRRGQGVPARQKYEAILLTNRTLPNGELYQGKFASVHNDALEVLKQLAGQPHAPTNPRMTATITQAAMRLRYLAQGFNFYGIGPDEAPVLRFKYLQSVATYLADSAIEAERTFVSYRSTAENQKMDHLQLQSAVDVNQAAAAIENKKLEDAALEIEAARRTREYAELRRDNADDALAEWDTSGRELTSMNASLSWAGQAANDQDIRYTGVRYDGARHDYEGTVEEFFDTVGEKREWLDWEMQRNRIERQRAEAAAEVAMTQVREQQAEVRFEVQQLSVLLAQVRLEGAQEMLEYADDRMFDEDLWFQLAAQLQELSRSYLDAGIYAALVMERAYDLEFDRRLNRIRTDYALGGPEGLLGGDHLKRDIISFTSDYLLHAQKQNPVRLAISLREEFPSGFATFIETGLLPFRTDLELFDRRYPGTFRRKIKRIEVFVEGLVPLEGASGFLTNNGVCADWRFIGGAWTKHIRVMPVDRMVLSSYQFRRDIAVFQPSEELLALFENCAPQCEWTIELPRSGNNLDYQAISDVKFVVYLDADHSDSLAAHVKAFYPTTGGRSTVLSARFHYPDEYFRLDAERSVDFAVSTAFFTYNHVSPTLRAMGVRLVATPGQSVANLGLVVTRLSDNISVAVTTDASGTVACDPVTMAPFAAWLNVSPLNTWRVALADGVDAGAVADVQLSYSYAFSYRPDGTLV
ncbi:MAG: hypothetical protein JWQ88_1226 [Rhodoferax sp.]|nr:hypothetical protein [Rhodoferax sp.]